MMAPNPHWWSEPADRYDYTPNTRFFLFFWGANTAFLVVRQIFFPNNDVCNLLGTIVVVTLTAIVGLMMNPGRRRFEVRFTYLTCYRGTDVIEHQDMRDIVSLDSVLDRKGKARQYIAKFSTGKTISFYAYLGKCDELIAKLRGYLAAKEEGEGQSPSPSLA
ncbi:MAG: hypothetical protein GC165_04020 [Armatimonadetes bacterium]|nr:hypothetical protein [Armatimonadota bacterium]